jgi:hypothetical protein
MRWKLGELFAYFFQGKSNSLREHNERDSPEDFSRVASLAGTFPLGANQSFLFVESQRGSCDSASF